MTPLRSQAAAARPTTSKDGYTHLLGYHPILATRAETREALHIRLRKAGARAASPRLHPRPSRGRA